jgi:oligopeptide transport system ATP-binding protein
MLFQMENYQAHFYTRRGIVKAVDGLSYSVSEGQTLGIVGESGSGKSVSQLSYLGLLPTPPLRIIGGSVKYRGTDLLQLDARRLRNIRGNKISMIFQEPMTSLNPYLKIGTQLIEPTVVHHKIPKKEAWKRAIESLQEVGISDPEQAMNRYPHEFSGGMRQRVMIAMALTTKPEILIADEPTTALDVTVQAQILDLLRKIQKETGMAIILITHDLGVIAGLADRVAVMYGGKLLEEGSVDDIFYRSQNPYTLALLKSMPRLDSVQEKLPTIPGLPPDLSQLKSGCPFFERCNYKIPICEHVFPSKRKVAEGHETFCHVEKLA